MSDRGKTVAIIGQGYVGLPLAMAAVDAGWSVIGVENSRAKYEGIAAGVSPVEDVASELIKDAMSACKYKITNDVSDVAVASIVVICVPTPLYHCSGCVVGVLTAAAHGAACVFPSPAFSAKEAVKAIQQERFVDWQISGYISLKNGVFVFHRCTSLYGTPTMFVDILNLPDLKQYDLRSLSTGIMAGKF